MKPQIPFEPGEFYYLRSQTIGGAHILNSPQTCNIFLETYQEHLLHVFDTYAFSLLPTQYHFIIKVKNNIKLSPRHISRIKGNFLVSFTETYNNRNGRRGGIFIRPERRSLISSAENLAGLMKHIHLLPVYFNLVSVVGKWPYSSFPYITNFRASFLQTGDLIPDFRSMNKFMEFHESPSLIKPSFDDISYFKAA